MGDHLLPMFSASKIEGKTDTLFQQSVWLLPYLFPNSPAVTTNFDRVLETVYQKQNKDFDTVILPGRKELHNQLQQGLRHGLLKIHGDIGRETLEYSSIIFTESQYKKAYQPASAVVSDLQQWFSGKILFFLGCSLEMDNYLELLRQIVTMKPGLTHYAILECKNKKEADDRVRQLREELGIKVILYPKNRHEAVRVILEKLLEDTNPSLYQTLDMHIGALASRAPSDSFHYKSGATSFRGREKELKELCDFCSDETDKFKWWAVTGAGGAGKSRLVYEFTQGMKHSGWACMWLNSSNIKSLSSISVKTIIVVDYAQAYIDVVGELIEQLAETDRSLPVRILLIERDGKSLDECSWGASLKARARLDKNIKKTCWRENFLQLARLRDKDLLKVMQDYAVSRSKQLSSSEADRLLQTLKMIDPELQRPLYAMFITDAWANGKQPEQWGQDEILQYVIKREGNYFTEKLKDLVGNQARLRTLLRRFRLTATIWGGLTEEQLQEKYPELWNQFQQQADCIECVESESDLLRQAGLINGNMLSGLQPDLVGEYFVLKHIKDSQCIKLLFPAHWHTEVNILLFLHRLYWDYHDQLDPIEKFWENIFDANLPIFSTNERYIYAALLCNIAGLSKVYAQQAVDILVSLWVSGSKQEVDALVYAQGLFNLSSKQTSAAAEATIDKLRDLLEHYSDNAEIALAYAKGLFNLSVDQDAVEAEATIDKLRDLLEHYSDNAEIALAYAKGLVNLSIDQDAVEAEATIDKLRTLAQEHLGDAYFALIFSYGLVNLLFKQPAEESKDTLNELIKLCQQYPSNVELEDVYFKVLKALSDEQNEEG